MILPGSKTGLRKNHVSTNVYVDSIDAPEVSGDTTSMEDGHESGDKELEETSRTEKIPDDTEFDIVVDEGEYDQNQRAESMSEGTRVTVDLDVDNSLTHTENHRRAPACMLVEDSASTDIIMQNNNAVENVPVEYPNANINVDFHFSRFFLDIHVLMDLLFHPTTRAVSKDMEEIWPFLG